MEKIINLLIKEFIEGVDTYTHNGSTWLIYTESKQWVIELTKEKTLWYNYNFFKEIFEYTSMDVVENQHHITKWVEDNIIKGASDIRFRDARDRKQQFEDTIQNGVKEIKSDDFNVSQFLCEEVIDKGVKKTKGAHMKTDWSVEDTINNGVKETNHVDVMKFFNNKMEDTLKNGVKETNSWNDSIIGDLNQNGCIDNVIKNGVKETFDCDWNVPTDLLEDVINDGVKETKTPNNGGDILLTIEWMDENKTKSVPDMIDDIIENGVKETKVSDYCGNNAEYFITDQYLIDEVIDNGVKVTKVCNYIHPEMNSLQLKTSNEIDEVINNGVKKTLKVENGTFTSIGFAGQCENVIENGVKVSGTFVGGKRQKEDVESVIGYGTKNPTG